MAAGSLSVHTRQQGSGGRSGSTTQSAPSSPPQGIKAARQAPRSLSYSSLQDSQATPRGASRASAGDMEAGPAPLGAPKHQRPPGGLSSLISRIERRPAGGSHRSWTPLRVALLSVTAIALLFAGSGFSAIRQDPEVRAVTSGGTWGGAVASGGARPVDTLAIYIYSKSDPEYEQNLRFFIRHAVTAGDGCEYVIVVQQGDDLEESGPLPELPDNARYEWHPNECFDWGTIGWVLGTKRVDTSRYKWFVFLNSSTRGPFLPAYWPRDVHWSRAFTGRITDDTKLVGATISCESTLKDGDANKGSRQNAHVQSYAMATDQEGLAVLQADGKVFQCHHTIDDTVWHSELGASLAIMEAGYNLDSLMMRYQGVDWRDPAFWQCNAGENPYKEHSLDGANLAPTEVLFVKVKAFLLDLGWSSASAAARYDHWMAHRGNASAVTSNQYLAMLRELKKKSAFEMALRGFECFDVPFYERRNRDLPPMSPSGRWSHFVMFGQFEGRPFRFKCNAERQAPLPVPGQSDTPKTKAQVWAEASEVDVEEMVTVGLQASQQFQDMLGEPEGLVAAAKEYRQHGPGAWKLALKRRNQRVSTDAQAVAQQRQERKRKQKEQAAMQEAAAAAGGDGQATAAAAGGRGDGDSNAAAAAAGAGGDGDGRTPAAAYDASPAPSLGGKALKELDGESAKRQRAADEAEADAAAEVEAAAAAEADAAAAADTDAFQTEEVEAAAAAAAEVADPVAQKPAAGAAAAVPAAAARSDRAAGPASAPGRGSASSRGSKPRKKKKKKRNARLKDLEAAALLAPAPQYVPGMPLFGADARPLLGTD